MKKHILFILFILISALAMAGGNYILQISGNVYEDETQIPFGGRSVWVSIERTGTFPGYYAELQTNDDGFVFAVIEIPKDVETGTVHTEIEDCNGQIIIDEQIFSEEDAFVHFSIPICDESFVLCNADFFYQAIITDVPRSYSYFFTDQSQGSGSIFFWDFGDGTTSSEKNVTHSYQFAGEYNVCHSIATQDGSCADTIYQTIVIDSILNHDCGVTFEPVYFSGLTAGFQAYTESPYPTIFEWDFGDGTTGMGAFVMHTFPEEGEYTVTVTGEDTQFCTNSYQLEITVSDTLEPCEAWFVAVEDTTNPFHFNFFDMSNGEIAFWHWDFGDGNYSELQNPEHGYSLNGNYNVTLTVEDTANQCSSYVTRVLVVDYHPECVADFEFELDSLSSRRNHYHFENKSIIEFPGEVSWDFGDGEQIVTWQTSHIYDVGGTYDVTLNITDQFGYCSETVQKSLTTPEYMNIGGYLFNGDFPINNPYPEGDTAIAYLYRKLTDGLHLVDTMEFYEYGYYYFTWLLKGEYIVKSKLMDESTHFGSFFPVYYPSALKWQEAEFIEVSAHIYDCNTSLVGMETMSTGPGYISGRILIDGSGTRSYDPVNILLYSEDNDALLYDVTDEYGFFTFENIPYGCYNVVAESTGDFSLPANVCLDESDPGAEDIEIEIYEEDVTGIEDEDSSLWKKIFVFPVPAQATLNISFESTEHNRASISVLNFAGQVVYQEDYTFTRGLNRHQIPVEDLSSGIYVLKITTPANGEAFVSKFIRD
jgi:PKD repeat protein